VIYACCTPLRRSVVRAKAGWNAIDFLEVVDRAAADPADRQRVLEIHFVKSLGTLTLQPSNIRIEGGERIQNIKVVAEGTGPSAQDDVFTVKVDQAGDFSLYTLRIVTDTLNDTVPAGIDPQLSAVQFSFKVECPSPFDCAPQNICPPEPQAVPEIDYLAKDYASFRRLMLDRMAVLMPAWTERNPADAGVMLVEALAYTADQLSYQQDAIATEAYLGTARKRISLRRHARLMDYFISEGCNARTWVHLKVSADVTGIGGPAVPAGTKIATQIANQQTVIADDLRVYEQAEVIFETMKAIDSLFLAHNQLSFYTWSDDRCCLPQGATRATLAGHYPNLTSGMILIVEEVLGAQTGDPADADPARRHALRLKSVMAMATDNSPRTDPVTGSEITEIVWNDDDALPFPLCLWQYEDSEENIRQVSVARGNIVLADHGLTFRDESLGTVPQPFLFMPLASGGDNCAPAAQQPILPRFRPRLANLPLTHAGPGYDDGFAESSAMQWSLRDVQPIIRLTDANGRMWTARRDLLNSSGDAEEFVAEIDNDGAVVIRFGDDVHGRQPEPGTEFFATYRVGNGRAGNIGANALKHIALSIPEIVQVRNPLPATGGQESESLEDVRQRAPVAYRVQERAVTPADYAEVTERHADVQRAAATFRWTGSWHTVFLTVDRSAGAALSEDFETDIRNHVERYRMAGHDLEVDKPQFVALEIDLHVCVAADHFRSDVERELFDALSNRDLSDGQRGLFHPDNFTFGQPVYLSAIYAAAHQVTGVESVEVRTFQRLGVPDNTALESGRLDIDYLEIARLDNDRNFAERGQLTISLGGGK
jgi:Baseplate J-like protein